ncbi:MAG TPA: hypothetical protein VFX70_04210 [Mycobacteriales bacterium]|nr:hypothetical protein [Mycobacteriales bacterium]
MRVNTTSDPRTFASRAGDWLAREPVANNVLLVHALDPAGIPPGDGEPVFAWIEDPAGSVLGAGFTRAPYRMTISAMPVAASRALAERLAELQTALPGVNGPTDAATQFAARWSELAGTPAHREREQWIMQCLETVRPADPPGRPRLATHDDLDMVAEWFSASMRDSGMTRQDVLRRSRHLVGGQLAGKRLIVWEAEDGTPVGAAGWAPPIAGVVRPSGVFVVPERRDGGYATLLLGEVTARALESGVDACVCTHYLKYQSMQAVVENVGYRRLLDLVEYRFD